MAISTPSESGPTLVSPQSTISKPPPARRRSAKRAEPASETAPGEKEPTTASDADDEVEAYLDMEEDDDSAGDDGDEEVVAKVRPGRRKLAAYPDFNSPIDLRSKKEDFEVWLANIDPDCWEFLIAYLYRTHPINDSSETGKPRYIRKFGSPFTYETIKQTEGSGAYKLDFCAIDPDTRKQRRIDRIYFELDDKDFPPRMPYGPWAERPENLKWAWCKSKLEGAPVDESAPAAGGSGGESTVQVIRATMAAMNSQGQQGSHMNDLMARMADPSYHLTFMKSLKDIIGGGKSEGDAGVVQMMMLMLDRSDKAQERMHAEMMQMRKDMTDRQAQTIAAAAPKTLTEQLEEQVKVKQLARQLAGGDRGAKDDDDMPGWLKPVIEAFGPPLAAIIATRFVPAPAAQPQAGQAPRPAAQATTQQPPAATQQPQAHPQENPEMDPRAIKLMKHQGTLQHIFPFLIDHFVNGVGEPEQSSGCAFRDWFLERHGEEKLDEFRADLAPEFVVEYVAAVPALASALQLNVVEGKLDASGAAELTRFMQDFYSPAVKETVNA